MAQLSPRASAILGGCEDDMGWREETVFALSHNAVVWLVLEMSSWLSLCPATGAGSGVHACQSVQRGRAMAAHSQDSYLHEGRCCLHSRFAAGKLRLKELTPGPLKASVDQMYHHALSLCRALVELDEESAGPQGTCPHPKDYHLHPSWS